MGTGHTLLLLPAHHPGNTLANSWPLLPLPRQPLALRSGCSSALAWGWLSVWWAALRHGWSMNPVLFRDLEAVAKAPINLGRVRQRIIRCELPFLSSGLITGK